MEFVFEFANRLDPLSVTTILLVIIVFSIIQFKEPY